ETAEGDTEARKRHVFILQDTQALVEVNCGWHRVIVAPRIATRLGSTERRCAAERMIAPREEVETRCSANGADRRSNGCSRLSSRANCARASLQSRTTGWGETRSTSRLSTEDLKKRSSTTAARRKSIFARASRDVIQYAHFSRGHRPRRQLVQVARARIVDANDDQINE